MIAGASLRHIALFQIAFGVIHFSDQPCTEFHAIESGIFTEGNTVFGISLFSKAKITMASRIVVKIGAVAEIRLTRV